MREKGFRKYLETRKLKPKAIDSSISDVRELEKHLKQNQQTLDSVTSDKLREYISLLIKKGKNSEKTLIAIARYCYYTKKNDLYTYMASTLGATNVLPDVKERLTKIAGEQTSRRVYEGIEFPPLGADQDEYPRLTKTILDRMEAEVPTAKCREVMTWNYHNVPTSVFSESKRRFEQSASINEYLEGEHKRLVSELESCMKKGRLWYEQEITPEVLEFVRNNQEINTGVRRGDRIFKIKIPYSPKQFLQEKDPSMRAYYACHCQLVRTALRDGRPKVSPNFCYCSAGYEKLHFDVIFGQPVEAEVLETLLKGDPRCRFSIKIPKAKMK